MQYFDYVKFLNKILEKEHKKKLILLVILMVILVIFESFSFSLILPVINSLIPSNEKIFIFEELFNKFNFINTEYKFIFFSTIFLFIYFIKIFFNIYFSWFQNNFFCIIQGYLSDKLYKKYIFQNIIFHKNSDISILLRNLNSELSIFLREGMSSIISIVSDVLIILGITSIILIYQPKITFFLLLFILFFSFIFISINKYFLQKWSQQRQEYEGLRLKFLNQGLFSIKEIKIYNKENWITKKFFSTSSKTFKALRNYDFFQILPRMFLEIILIIGIAACIFFFFKSNKISEGISYLSLIVFASFRILPILSKLLRSIQSLAYSKSTFDLLKKEFNLKSESKVETLEKNFTLNEKIELKNISFKYENSKRYQIENLNLEINKNDCIGLMGDSGQGKSTLLDIFMGLIVPTNGEIIIDKKNINQSYRAWQNLIGYVPQNIYLSDDTIKNNIAFGVDEKDIDENKINMTIKETKLNKLIENLPNGLNEHVGNQGGKLSGGEKQRVAIARALYFNPEILILDEATSSLDIETEENVMKSIKNLFENKTSLIVAHRESALVNCNKIYKITNGKINKIIN